MMLAAFRHDVRIMQDAKRFPNARRKKLAAQAL
jgi:hypothetical protein